MGISADHMKKMRDGWRKDTPEIDDLAFTVLADEREAFMQGMVPEIERLLGKDESALLVEVGSALDAASLEGDLPMEQQVRLAFSRAVNKPAMDAAQLAQTFRKDGFAGSLIKTVLTDPADISDFNEYAALFALQSLVTETYRCIPTQAWRGDEKLGRVLSDAHNLRYHFTDFAVAGKPKRRYSACAVFEAAVVRDVIWAYLFKDADLNLEKRLGLFDDNARIRNALNAVTDNSPVTLYGTEMPVMFESPEMQPIPAHVLYMRLHECFKNVSALGNAYELAGRADFAAVAHGIVTQTQTVRAHIVNEAQHGRLYHT